MAWRKRIVLVVVGAVAMSAACTPTPPDPYVGREQVMYGFTNVTAVTTGQRHSCALRTNGTVWCWGSNRAGEFGNGQTGIQTYTLTPNPVTGLTNAIAVSTGVDHTCAVLSGGTAECWGANARGQLGDGNAPTSALTPTAVSGLTNVTAIAAGGQFTCALIGDGHVSCWGANNDGQLGIGNTTDSSTPTTVDGITDATAIAVGTWSACAIRAGGAVSCWGYAGTYGILGDGATTGTGTFSTDPVSVSGLTGATSVAILSRSTPDDGMACASLGDHTVWCWGEHILGDGTSNDSPTPVQVSGITTALAVSGGSVPCALLPNGVVDCWGDDTQYGYLGDGKMVPSYVPIPVHHLLMAIGLSTGTGSGQTCAADANGRIMCWGIVFSPGYAA
jgi:alpha-tubulin suppressor-like RCC1 family protein